MSRPLVATVVVLAMILAIVGVDVVVFRHHTLARLLANVGIVLLVAAFWLRFARHD